MTIRQRNLTPMDWRVIFTAMRLLGDYSPAVLDNLIDARTFCRSKRLR